MSVQFKIKRKSIKQLEKFFSRREQLTILRNTLNTLGKTAHKEARQAVKERYNIKGAPGSGNQKIKGATNKKLSYQVFMKFNRESVMKYRGTKYKGRGKSRTVNVEIKKGSGKQISNAFIVRGDTRAAYKRRPGRQNKALVGMSWNIMYRNVALSSGGNVYGRIIKNKHAVVMKQQIKKLYAKVK